MRVILECIKCLINPFGDVVAEAVANGVGQVFPEGSDPGLFAEVDGGFGEAEPVEGNVSGVPLFFELMYAAVAGAAAKAVGVATHTDGILDHMMV